jgi:hypothetical protein
MKKNLSFTFLLVLSLFTASFNLHSQDKTRIKPYVTFQYFKNTDDQRILKTTLTYSLNRMELPLPGMQVTFYNSSKALPIVRERQKLNLQKILNLLPIIQECGL